MTGIEDEAELVEFAQEVISALLETVDECEGSDVSVTLATDVVAVTLHTDADVTKWLMECRNDRAWLLGIVGDYIDMLGEQ